MLSIEAFVITNLAMNLLVLTVSARRIGHVRWRRVLAAAGVGTAYAALAYVWIPALRGFAAQSACLLVMALVLFAGPGRGSRWIHGIACIAVGCVFAGGVMALLAGRMKPGSPLMTAVGLAVVALCAFLSDGIGRSVSRETTVLLRIATRMGSTEIEALVDTGNRLHEPLSGLPVIIVGRRYLKGLLDDSCLVRPGGRLPPGFRIVRYGVLGGNGEMYCFRPESVCIWRKGRWSEAPDVWIAVCMDEIPSGVQALTPPVF